MSDKSNGLTRNSPSVVKLAAEAECDPRTALAAMRGEGVRAMVMLRIERAAKKLKIRLPSNGRA